MGSRRVATIVGVVLNIVGCIVWIYALQGQAGSDSPFPKGDGMIGAVRMNLPGVSNPPLIAADAVQLRDDEIVIGIKAFGVSRAYLRRAFEHGPDSHIVNDELGNTYVTVTHCDRTRCTRVFAAGKPKTPLDIYCGGWLAEQEMSLRIEGKEYAQSSRKISLQDVPFVVTTWKLWRDANPSSSIYLGRGPSAFHEPPQLETDQAAL